MRGRLPIVLFILTFCKSIQLYNHKLSADYICITILAVGGNIQDTYHTFISTPTVYYLLNRVGSGDISALRDGLIGSCSSTFSHLA